MFPGNRVGVSSQLMRMLAGLETGVLGGMAMLAWLALISRLLRRPVWAALNLAGSLLDGRQALQGDFGWTTVAGLSLLVFSSGVVGMLFAIIVGDARNRLRTALLALVTALVWYYFTQSLFWNRLGVLANVYVSPRSLLFAHLLFGLVLGWYPAALGSARRHFAPESLPIDGGQ